MKTNAVVALVLACVLGVTAAAGAQEQKSQKVSGTVSSIQGTNLMVKTAAGKEVMVMLDAKTTITKDKKKVEAKSLKAGDAIDAEGPGDNAMIMAKTVAVGPAAKPAKK